MVTVFNNLPHDIIGLIAGHLTIKDAGSLGLCGKKTYEGLKASALDRWNACKDIGYRDPQNTSHVYFEHLQFTISIIEAQALLEYKLRGTRFSTEINSEHAKKIVDIAKTIISATSEAFKIKFFNEDSSYLLPLFLSHVINCVVDCVVNFVPKNPDQKAATLESTVLIKEAIEAAEKHLTSQQKAILVPLLQIFITFPRRLFSSRLVCVIRNCLQFLKPLDKISDFFRQSRLYQRFIKAADEHLTAQQTAEKHLTPQQKTILVPLANEEGFPTHEFVASSHLLPICTILFKKLYEDFYNNGIDIGTDPRKLAFPSFETLADSNGLSGIASLQSEKEQIADTSLQTLWQEIIKNTSFGAAPALTTADEIRDWMKDPKNAGQLNNINNLDLSNKNLQIIPPEIKYLTHLSMLNLTHNRIRTIQPGAFNGLDSLINLDLSQNKIYTIPEGAFNGLNSLRQLRFLN